MLIRFEDYLRHEVRRSPHTITAYLNDVREFDTWLDTVSLTEVSTTDVRGWIAMLAEQTHGGRQTSAATLRRKAQSLRAFYHFLQISHVRDDNPAADVKLPKLPKPLPEFVRTDQIESLLANTQDTTEAALSDDSTHFRNNLLLEILYATGIRRAELLSLTDSDVDTYRMQLHILGKRNKQRIVPIAPGLLERIQLWQQLRDEAWPDAPHPRHIAATAHGPMSISTLYNIVKGMLAGTATGRRSPHTLRHTFATSMLNAGADLNSVREFLGHTSLATTQIYTHLSFAELRDNYRKAHPRAAENSNTSQKNGKTSES